ncbi:MAG: IS3 family transposase [Chloroflexi bacterium]|nr:IS3 family transposase [Chloroflexota bacterium]
MLSAADRGANPLLPNPEVPERAHRRRFTAEYKLRILREIDGCKDGEIGALLRRENLYSSLLSTWRRQRNQGELDALTPRKRGRPPGDPQAAELARLRQENERLTRKLVIAETIIDVQKKGLRPAGDHPGDPGAGRPAVMESIAALAPTAGTAAACRALGVPRTNFYRWRRPPSCFDGPSPVPVAAVGAERRSSRALVPSERQAVLDALHSPRFVDAAPAQVYATLLDEGVYLASERTMYRILAQAGETGERRNQLTHPAYPKPELLATGPNQVWSWDITKLRGPAKWTYFHLYVILDIYSRAVVGWMVAYRESAALAERLIAETAAKQGIRPGQLTVHADRGSSMTSKPVAFLLADLGITKSHSRPYVSDDNPYSESQFKTLKYRPGFPDRFLSMEEARSFCQTFFPWYNREHRHSGIGLLPPDVVHTGQAEQVYAARHRVLAAAYTAHPERFVNQAPIPPPLPTAAWINPPAPAPTLKREEVQ